jgi:hypothetical protein
MIVASIVVIFTIVSLIIGYVTLSEPISLISETLKDVYPSDNMETKQSVDSMMDAIPYFFIVAISLGIISVMIWYLVWGHKKEYEKY